MIAQITNKIPEQGFELITKQLGAILLCELENQNALNCTKYDLGVFLERQEPMDKSEDVLINVMLANVNYETYNERDSQGPGGFNVDVYVRGTESMNETGNDNVRLKLHQVVGWVRYILQWTGYKTLGLEPGLIGGTYVDGITFDDNYGNQDGAFVRMARINFRVRGLESQEVYTGVTLLGNDTQIKLSNTEKGYKLIFNN